jgi:6-phosphogluconolactonase
MLGGTKAMSANQQRMLVFVGSYAEADDSSVYVYSFDEERGELALLEQVSGLKNPTFLNVDVPRQKLYAIAEGIAADGAKTGDAVAFSFDPQTGKLTELNRGLGVDAPLCHISRDAESRYLVLSSYHGGRVGLVGLTEDGRIGQPLDTKQHEGQGVNPARQDRPHVHSASFAPDGKYVLVADLGIDRIKTYAIDTAQGELVLQGETALHPGAGPRHLTFHPNGRFVYAINEVDSTMTAFRYDASTGALHTLQTVSTLPEGFEAENTTAEVAVSEDGRFLYGSNRGHDSIVVYSIDQETGLLSLVEHVSSGGGHPRHFSLTPGGRYLIAANRDADNLVVFRVGEDGRLQATGTTAQVSKPVCVKPVYV